METSSAAVMDAVSSRNGSPKRQHRSLELKRQIPEETLARGAIHGPRGAGARSERRPSVRLAASLSARAAQSWQPCRTRVADRSACRDRERTRKRHQTPSQSAGLSHPALTKGQLRLTRCVDTGNRQQATATDLRKVLNDSAVPHELLTTHAQ